MYPKLVRNLIPQIVAKNSKRIPCFYKATDEEYWQKLKEKLIEEVNEFIGSENTEELADILEVIEAITIFKKISSNEITIIKNKKAQSHGTFSEKIILSSIKEES